MPENDNKQFPQTEREGWNAEEVADESTNQPSDEIQRQMSRGDETRGDADKRDVAGGVNSNETPQGRENTKKN